MAFVYILKTSLGYYIGSTINLERRVMDHKNGYSPATKRMGLVELIFSQKYNTLSEARKIERKLKKFKRKDFIEKIVADGKINIRS